MKRVGEKTEAKERKRQKEMREGERENLPHAARLSRLTTMLTPTPTPRSATAAQGERLGITIAREPGATQTLVRLASSAMPMGAVAMERACGALHHMGYDATTQVSGRRNTACCARISPLHYAAL